MKTMNSILPSKRIIASYIFDWIVIIAIAGVGGGFNSISPNHRPFSLLDLSISLPYVHKEKIPTWLLIVVGLVIPAIIVFLVCLIFVPGRAVSRGTPKALVWRRKFWEWNTGWMGLALSLATAFMITEGMKNLFGKPRPDLLSRCNPKVSQVSADRLGGDGMDLSPLWVLVSSSICQQTDKSILDDGFRSFPSGHSSFSWAGLLYLTLFLCSKFAIAIPFLPPRPYSQDPTYTNLSASKTALPAYHSRENTDGSNSSSSKKPRSEDTFPSQTLVQNQHIVPIRNQAAAPPVYVLVLALIPICAAIYISSTRFSDFRHHGFDILFGSAIGIICAYFSFRWYHLPIRQGAGWSWGARSRDRAWFIGVGRGSYVGTEGWAAESADENVRKQSAVLGGGLDGAKDGETPRGEEAV
ncbi:PAP2-domain-containing protein [Mytilinidion resinicola]|uniref:PAP2-domain-containing protein n=1 Tax=Mytilinidion resinicola TaxID=574789 RepID=A0A6A6Z017_9PEZI|nr:PAP2-domain-containing protein [Mytilinidion resinicola]KAF2813525.1 PAP2-domain-containing protein [Mytilinidion resinicola]